MIVPLEDGIGDILSKAQKGLGWSTEALAERAGLHEGAVRSLRKGDFETTAMLSAGKALGLNEKGLRAIARGEWHPKETGELPGFAMFSTPFHEWTVNAFVVWDADSREAVAFDTGTNSEPMVAFLKARGLNLRALILTHTHWDHLEGLEELRSEWEFPVFCSFAEEDVPRGAKELTEDFDYAFGSIRLRALRTPGHTADGMTLMIDGLIRPLAIVGDALFAGSMGGANVSYEDALESLERILTLPEETVLAPGHGPTTTVAEEREMNCFAGAKLRAASAGFSALP